jgi:hypothetical protein
LFIIYGLTALRVLFFEEDGNTSESKQKASSVPLQAQMTENDMKGRCLEKMLES